VPLEITEVGPPLQLLDLVDYDDALGACRPRRLQHLDCNRPRRWLLKLVASAVDYPHECELALFAPGPDDPDHAAADAHHLPS
jgi:hypothetical protein